MRIWKVLMCALFGHKMGRFPWWGKEGVPSIWSIGHQDHPVVYSVVVCARCTNLYVIEHAKPEGYGKAPAPQGPRPESK